MVHFTNIQGSVYENVRLWLISAICLRLLGMENRQHNSPILDGLARG